MKMKNQYVSTDDEDTDSTGSRQQNRSVSSPKGVTSSAARIVLLRRPEKTCMLEKHKQDNMVSSDIFETPQLTECRINVLEDSQEQSKDVSHLDPVTAAGVNGSVSISGQPTITNTVCSAPGLTLEQREIAYEEARKRIFGTNTNNYINSPNEKLSGIEENIYKQAALQNFRKARLRGCETERIQQAFSTDVSSYCSNKPYVPNDYRITPSSDLIFSDHTLKQQFAHQYPQMLYQEPPCYTDVRVSTLMPHRASTLYSPSSNDCSNPTLPQISFPSYVTSCLPTTNSETYDDQNNIQGYNINQQPIDDPVANGVEEFNQPFADSFCKHMPFNSNTQQTKRLYSPPQNKESLGFQKKPPSFQTHTTKPKLSSYDINFPPLGA